MSTAATEVITPPAGGETDVVTPPTSPVEPGLEQVPSDNLVPPPLPDDSVSGGAIIPPDSDGFDIGSFAGAGFDALPPVLFAAAGILLLVSVAIGAFVVFRGRHAERRSELAKTVTLLGAIAFVIAGLVAITLQGAGASPTAADGMPQWAAAKYTIEITDEQADLLAAGQPISVEYLGGRILLEGAIAADGKLYLFNSDGNELPASPDEYGMPTGEPVQ